MEETLVTERPFTARYESQEDPEKLDPAGFRKHALGPNSADPLARSREFHLTASANHAVPSPQFQPKSTLLTLFQPWNSNAQYLGTRPSVLVHQAMKLRLGRARQAMMDGKPG